MKNMSQLIDKCKVLKEHAQNLALASGPQKNEALDLVAQALLDQKDWILNENKKDIHAAQEKGTKQSLIDRLALNENRIQGMVESIQTVIAFEDPIWTSQKTWTTDEGLTISRMNVPLGVIGIIYESRPNVTVDAFALALKSGNAILLRGSSSALHSNLALVKIIKDALESSALSPDLIQYIEDPSYDLVDQMIQLNDYIDVIIPRGGAGLISSVVENATVPTIQTGTGNCHIFVDESAKFDDALKIVHNAKTQRPGTCNTVETLLVHEKIAEDFLPKLKDRLGDQVELKACEKALEIIDATPATEEDWATEYLDDILAIRVVANLDEAIDHIQSYTTHHSEAILTENVTNANKFLHEVDAAAVYLNASTRFTDGGVFGFGGEMGISTQKLHARGPIGINELVTEKYTIIGTGQARE